MYRPVWYLNVYSNTLVTRGAGPLGDRAQSRAQASLLTFHAHRPPRAQASPCMGLPRSGLPRSGLPVHRPPGAHSPHSGLPAHRPPGARSLRSGLPAHSSDKQKVLPHLVEQPPSLDPRLCLGAPDPALSSFKENSPMSTPLPPSLLQWRGQRGLLASPGPPVTPLVKGPA